MRILHICKCLLGGIDKSITDLLDVLLGIDLSVWEGIGFADMVTDAETGITAWNTSYDTYTATTTDEEGNVIFDEATSMKTAQSL